MNQPTRRPTLSQVAAATGYSSSTVSRAIRQDPRITPKTRERIQAVAESMGFTQNALASSLRSGGNSSLVGLLIPSVQDPFFAAVATGVQEAAAEQGRDVMIGIHNNSAEEQERLVRQMVSHRVEAIIITPAPGPPPASLRTEAQFGTTVVAVDCPTPGLRCDSITTDNAAGAETLVRELLARGHRRFAVVSLDQDIWTQQVRLETIARVLAEEGIEFDPDALATAELNGTIPQEQLDAMLRAHEPTAVIGLSIMPIVQAIDAGTRLCMEFDLACFDGHPLFELLDVRVICVEQSASDLGRAAIERLVERQQDRDIEPENLILPVRDPIVRGRRRDQ